eukprot:Ihof_evm10s171 gene=Ihof_evmTU10s171
MIGLRALALFCAAFAAVSGSPVMPALPYDDFDSAEYDVLSVLPDFGKTGNTVNVCAYVSKHCSGPSVCDTVSLNECKGLSAFNLSFSVKLSLDEATNVVTFQRFKDSDCSVPHPSYTPAPSGELDTCIGYVA